ncbi:hypothetical protein H8S10_00960 [Clostridium sp. NSJ-49]|uniref:oligosaccharide flippase family protein n=1 Tax=Clostridium TaxID=1485 RepID=UPI00164B141F|nr:oligosaccharide flippase family protein [Clostridium sp. NSJ-49]MBC5624029.1 hypothetical protein [Clostridium sp. NSJ-49]
MNKYDIDRNKQTAINLTSSLIVFGVNLIISFFLSPYVVKTLGVEANGFVSLANTFISYATLITIALNSMAGRFITIAIHKEDYKTANKYFNSVFIGNLIITSILLLPALICIIKLESIINISSNLVLDVKILFSILFINFLVIQSMPSWGTATFAANKLYLQSIRGMESNLIRIGVILLLFLFFSPHVYYVGLATMISGIYSTYFNRYYQKKLIPQLKIKKGYFKWETIKELISSGIWNTITNVGQILLSGLDLLITNLFIGPVEMGVLALSKTIPNIIISLAGTLTSTFMPSLTIDYAKGEQESLKNNLKQGMKIIAILITIPLAILIVYGKEFYSLWVPSEDATLLHVLSVLTCFGLIFTSGIQCLYNAFTVANNLKTSSILLLASGVISTIIVFILLKTTNLGIFAVAGVSSFVNLIRNMLYNIPAASKCLKLKWNTFYPEVFISVFSVIALTIVGTLIKKLIVVNSWLTLIIAAICTGVIGLIINIIIILDKDIKIKLFNCIKKKLNLA